jgi:hypothetical protein
MSYKVYTVTAYDAKGNCLLEADSVGSSAERAIYHAGPTLAARAPNATDIRATPKIAQGIPGSSWAEQDMRSRL